MTILHIIPITERNKATPSTERAGRQAPGCRCYASVLYSPSYSIGSFFSMWQDRDSIITSSMPLYSSRFVQVPCTVYCSFHQGPSKTQESSVIHFLTFFRPWALLHWITIYLEVGFCPVPASQVGWKVGDLLRWAKVSIDRHHRITEICLVDPFQTVILVVVCCPRLYRYVFGAPLRGLRRCFHWTRFALESLRTVIRNEGKGMWDD